MVEGLKWLKNNQQGLEWLSLRLYIFEGSEGLEWFKVGKV